MRILIGSLTYPLLNGVTTSINLSIDGLTERSHQVVVIGPEYNLGTVRPEHQTVPSSWVGRLLLKSLHKKERLFGWSGLAAIREIAAEFQPDIYWLHSLTWSSNAFERAMLGSQAKKVLTYHTLVEDYGRIYGGKIGATIMRQRSKIVANRVNAVIAPSQVIAQRLKSYGVTSPIFVIPTGITVPKNQYTKSELAARWRFNPDWPILLYVGRVSAEKNIQALLEMTKRLNQTKKHMLLLVGPGDILGVEKQAAAMGIAAEVICSGPLPKEDAQRTYGAADVFVFASKTETQGLVIGEAMMAGLPVVALQSPIQPEVYPTSSAIVVESVDQFASSVSEILTDPQRRKILTANAKQFVEENFSVQGMTAKQIELFENLIA